MGIGLGLAPVSEQGSSADRSGLGFVGLLTILFIVLKLSGKISWAWLWVLSPIWIGFLVGLVLVMTMIVWEILVD